MASAHSTMEYLLEVLADSGQVSSRRMFGEFCLYYAGRPIGLVCDDQLFLKPSEAGRRLMKSPDQGAPFPGARPHLRISPDDWDDRPWMNALVRATFDSLPAPKAPRAAAAPAVARKPPAKAKDIAELSNLGPKSKDMLADAGIRSVAQLRALGAVAAYARVRAKSPRASLNLLWALEGALSGLPWQTVAREHRTSLLLALEQAQAALAAPAAPARTPRSKAR